MSSAKVFKRFISQASDVDEYGRSQRAFKQKRSKLTKEYDPYFTQKGHLRANQQFYILYIN